MKFINFDTVLKCDKNNVINKNKFTLLCIVVKFSYCWKNRDWERRIF